MNTDRNSRVFCAIDTVDIDLAVSIVEEVREHIAGVKLGLEFFGRHGPNGVHRLLGLGTSIFLDLKFFDIPNTVAGAVTAVASCRPSLITLHAAGGENMIKAAVDSNKEAALRLGMEPPTLLGVTVLTSFGQRDLASLGVKGTVDDQVLRLAELSERTGLDGVVCSAHELRRLRGVCSSDFKLVVPGIRPHGADTNDQKRIMTPYEAMAAGADFLVIGRPITKAPNIEHSAREIAREVERALDT
ncbi:MAG: orotidine-5'-phosphate decarboxylase [Rhodospirillaceae bacterium]|nr:orotidine-5'-phosphate decarboxylase [Rhodospirillaceae bacterium]|tara:strand:+ start:6361 stop:7092 length:732 start_codon:yes stop_codon:yes gene_type:complete